jgi:LysM repeat protein
MFPAFKRFIVILILIQALTACTETTQEGLESSALHVTLLPYHTAIAMSTKPIPTSSQVIPSVTPEPVIYTVVLGDSLSSIALRFGVDLNALIQANPAVNATAMSIGTKLIIPPMKDVKGTQPGSITSLPTPVIAVVGKPDCHRADDGQWVCFLLVNNELEEAVTNVAGQVKMTGESSSFTAICPLDLIPAGASALLVAQIGNTEIDPAGMEGNLTSAIPVVEKKSRYETVQIASQTTIYSTDKRSVVITGGFTLATGGAVRILAFAQDAQKHILGYRIWEAATLIPAGTTKSFQIHLYSLGGVISEIHLVSQVDFQ